MLETKIAKVLPLTKARKVTAVCPLTPTSAIAKEGTTAIIQNNNQIPAKASAGRKN